MPAATAEPEARPSGPIQVTAPKRERPAAEQTREYWLGTMPDSPRQNFAVDADGQAIEFTRYSGHYNVNESGEVEGNPKTGSRRRLTDKQVECLRKNVLHYVVRKSARPKDTGPVLNGKPIESEYVGDVLDVRGSDPKLAPHDEKGNAVMTYRYPGPGQPDDEPMARYLYLYPVEPGVALPENPEPMIARI